MPLYYITGIAGSGKSTVLSELRDRGFEAYDVDERGPVTAKWHNDTTGFIHPKSSVKKEDRTPEFLAAHSWRVPRQEVIELAQHAATKTIFLGGSIANETELDLFSAVFALVIDDNTLKHRLTTRTNNDWGQNPHELELTLAQNHTLFETYRQFKYIVINADHPIYTIVAEILDHAHHR